MRYFLHVGSRPEIDAAGMRPSAAFQVRIPIFPTGMFIALFK
jgi:hypothetical protein